MDKPFNKSRRKAWGKLFQVLAKIEMPFTFFDVDSEVWLDPDGIAGVTLESLADELVKLKGVTFRDDPFFELKGAPDDFYFEIVKLTNASGRQSPGIRLRWFEDDV